MSDDYTGRSVDLAVLQELNPTQLALTAADGQGRVVTGLMKLAQRFLLLLLTRIDSLPFAPLQGSTFLVDAALGNWRSVADVKQSFHAALFDIQRQLEALRTTDDHDDESFASAKLVNVEITAKTVQISVRITSRSGAQYTLIAPVATIPN